MGVRRVIKDWTLLNAVTSTTTATALNVSDFRNVILAIATDASSPNVNVRVQGSIGTDAPTFSSNRSASNQWEYIEVIDLEDGAAIDGDTGITFTGTNAQANVRLVEVNTNSLDWVCVQTTAHVAGTVTVKAHISTNE